MKTMLNSFRYAFRQLRRVASIEPMQALRTE